MSADTDYLSNLALADFDGYGHREHIPKAMQAIGRVGAQLADDAESAAASASAAAVSQNAAAASAAAAATFDPDNYVRKTVGDNWFSFVAYIYNNSGSIQAKVATNHNTTINPNLLIPFESLSGVFVDIQSDAFTGGLAYVNNNLHIKSSTGVFASILNCVASVAYNTTGSPLVVRPMIGLDDIGGDTLSRLVLRLHDASSGLPYNLSAMPDGSYVYIAVQGYA